MGLKNVKIIQCCCVLTMFVAVFCVALISCVFADSYYIWEDWGGIGVYDVEKSPTNNDDDMLCWAAAASNILDWTGWGDVSEYISTNNEIFQYYQDHWSDVGGHPYYGTKWWFDGQTPETQGVSGWSQVEIPGGGFWPGDDFFDYTQLTMDTTLTLAAVDSYLHNGYAVTLGVQGPGGHAVTCWGIEYENGSYTRIWITDSDDNKSDLDPPDVLQWYDVQFTADKWYLQDFYNSDSWYIDDVFGLEARSIDPVAEAVNSAFGLGLSAEEIKELVSLYNDGKAGLDPGNISIQGTEWQYYDILPGQEGHDFGDSYLFQDKMYIYLGSGIGEPLSGAVPEFPYSGMPLLAILFYWNLKMEDLKGYRYDRDRRVK